MYKKKIIIFYTLFWCFILSSCKKSESYYIIEDTNLLSPIVLNASFKSDENPDVLIEDVYGTIIGDSIIEFRIPYIVDNKNLIPCIEYKGEKIVWDSNSVVYDTENQNSNYINFNTPVILSVFDEHGNEKKYVIYVRTFTGLPILWIETDERVDITSKEEYVNANFQLMENELTQSSEEKLNTKVQIKCRGNSSYSSSPKKSYTLKFDQKISLLNEPKDKSWVLIANYFDKAMVRNIIAYYMGMISNLDYTPHFHFVELMLNGKYHGTYMLGDKLKIAENRVNVGKDGFLLEVDQRAISENAPYFETNMLSQPINIKDPDVVIGDDNYNFIKQYVLKAEEVLFSDNFTNPENGWQSYMDLESFVDWFLINEICKNGDAMSMYTSCYMNYKRDGKLKMGPLWDFDQSLGNNNATPLYPTDGFLFQIYNNKWLMRLFEDPIFRNKAKERFYYFYSRKDDILKKINSYVSYLKYSVEENENRWHTMNEFLPYVNRDVLGSYQNEVSYLKMWLINRFEWMKTAFDNID